MQDAVEVSGIILSAMPVNESDRRLLILTKELGKISCFARGARKPVSPLVGVTRPFSYGSFFLYPGKDSYSLSRAEIRDYFEKLVLSVEGAAYGCYFMELAGAFTREGTMAKEELNLLYFAFKALERGAVPGNLIRRIFELRLMRIEGLAPDFTTCKKCGKPLISGGFRPALMQAFCKECEPDLPMPLGKSAVYALQYMEETPCNKLFSFRVDEETEKEISQVTDYVLLKELDRPIPSREMLTVLLQN